MPEEKLNIADILKKFSSVPLPDGRGYGSRLSTGEDIIDFMLENLVGEVKVFNVEAAIPREGKPLVLLAAHGGLLGPMPMLAVLAREYVRRGLGDETIGFYTHRAIQRIPRVREIFERMGALYRIGDVYELARRLESGELRIAGNALEGVSCWFNWTERVGPFHTGGIVAAAIMSGAPVTLLAHSGTEPWHIGIDLPPGMTVPWTGGLRGINIPIGPVRRIERLKILCRRYRVGVKRTDFLTRMDRSERHAAIVGEMEAIRARLNVMMEEIIGME